MNSIKAVREHLQSQLKFRQVLTFTPIRLSIAFKAQLTGYQSSVNPNYNVGVMLTE